MKKIVLVSGVARSGTSALVNVLNASPDFLVGMERYFFLIRKEQITPDHFRKRRFLKVEDGDTHSKNLAMDQLDGAYAAATYVGDKFPLLFENFEYVFKAIPNAKHIYIVRNPLSVVESYDARHQDKEDKWRKSWQAGLDEWNASVRAVMNLTDDQLKHFHFVQYENFFGSPQRMNKLFESFDLPAVPEEKLSKFSEKFESLNARQVDRRDDIRMYVARNAAWPEYQRLLDLIDHRSAQS